MNPLQYTSEEMYSSTELIRKSKTIFDRLQKKDIEKAIILRDGKPAFMLLDFSVYEKIMKEYVELKNNQNRNCLISIEEKPIKATKKEEPKAIEEIDEKALEEALAQIDELNLDELDTNSIKIEEKEPLKEFWE